MGFNLIFSANAYNIRTVSDTLYGLLKQGLHYYPQHISWLRLSGEYEFGKCNKTRIQNFQIC